LKIADDEPHGKLPPGSAGEFYTLRRIIILKSRLNQHAGAEELKEILGAFLF
jgi:hypothetical protein